MEDQGIFKTCMFGGFDKQSVLSYVDDMIAKSQEREKEWKAQADELEAQLQKAREEAGKLSSENRELSEKVQKNAGLEAELSQKEARISELEAQIDNMNAQMAQMQATLQENEEQGHKYDAIVSQVGAVMVEAQKQADDIVGRAHQQAQQIAQESVDNIYEINKRLDQFKEDLYHLRAFAGQTLHAFDQRMEDLDLAVKQAEGHLYISAGAPHYGAGAYPVQEEYAPQGYAHGYPPEDYQEKYSGPYMETETGAGAEIAQADVSAAPQEEGGSFSGHAEDSMPSEGVPQGGKEAHIPAEGEAADFFVQP